MTVHPSPGPDPTDLLAESAKAELRRGALARRRSRSAAQIAAARTAIAGHLQTLLAGRGVIAGYLPLPSEPLDPELPARLAAAGTRVLLPVATAGAALDWVEYTGRSRTGDFGIQEPVGDLLGPAAVAAADAVLVPALLIDATGRRLGRGGGHYDRTLVAARGMRIGVVFDDELVDEVPTGPFDLPVTAVVTPDRGVWQVSPTG